MTHRKPVESWLTDMDGVLVHEGQPVPGAPGFIGTLRASGKPFLILTNNSIYTARDLQARLARIGIDVPESAIWTSALATAQFLDDQRPRGTAYVIGEAGLTTALHNAGYILSNYAPDYVVLGETRTYSFEAITTAVRLIDNGARFICTNPDPTGPSAEGALPAAGSVAAMISKATGVEPMNRDRKSTRLNSSHLVISYAVFCLKKKTTIQCEGLAGPSTTGTFSESPG